LGGCQLYLLLPLERRGLFIMQAAFLRKMRISANNLRKFILKMIFVWNWLLLSCRLAMASKFSGSFSKKPKPADFGIRHEKPHFYPSETDLKVPRFCCLDFDFIMKT